MATVKETAFLGFDPMDAFRFWASFSPFAPLFGVEYRFAATLPDFTTFMQAFGPQPYDGAVADAGEDEGDVVDLKAEAAIAPPAEAAPVGRPAGLLAAAPPDSDDLTRIDGVGPKMAEQLNALGVYKFAQLAGFGADDLAWLDDNLSGIKGACFRGDWAGQAKALAG